MAMQLFESARNMIASIEKKYRKLIIEIYPLETKKNIMTLGNNLLFPVGK
jgi:hypothetical protein